MEMTPKKKIKSNPIRCNPNKTIEWIYISVESEAELDIKVSFDNFLGFFLVFFGFSLNTLDTRHNICDWWDSNCRLLETSYCEADAAFGRENEVGGGGKRSQKTTTINEAWRTNSSKK